VKMSLTVPVKVPVTVPVKVSETVPVKVPMTVPVRVPVTVRADSQAREFAPPRTPNRTTAAALGLTASAGQASCCTIAKTAARRDDTT
jgi:hypothetical protein